MKVLDVAPWPILPARAGGPVRVFNLMRRLARRHDVIGFSHARSRLLARPAISELHHEDSYVDLQFAHPVGTLARKATEYGWVRAPVLTGGVLRVARPRRLDAVLSWADVVVVEFPWQFEHCRRRLAGTPIVYSSHNVEADKFRSYAEAGNGRVRWPWLRHIDNAEALACRHADLILAVSQADRDRFVHRYGVPEAKIAVVPNGADTEDLRPVDAYERATAKAALGLPDRPMALFMGGGPVPPNLVGLDWVRQLAVQEDGFTFVIIGAVSSPRVERPNLIHMGIVPDASPYLRAADVSLVPIHHGGGTKIKLLESLAMGLPTVAFAEAVSGTVLKDQIHLLVADRSVQSIQDSMHQIVGDRSLKARLIASGRDEVRRTYDWNSIALDLESALVRLVVESEIQRGRSR